MILPLSVHAVRGTIRGTEDKAEDKKKDTGTSLMAGVWRMPVITAHLTKMQGDHTFKDSFVSLESSKGIDETQSQASKRTNK